ncbi:S-adenosyl-L-methionine-dependent methyltransferase [Coprinopsis sp. MPI-PUGE-AT-0042]|nr:S-adenosyl-L-methionine-dependent methyltransferase [Coprinopsis sp. MPI-PUGE-AT-0042]
MATIGAKAIVENGYDTIAPAYLAWSAPRPTTTRMSYLSRLLDELPQSSKILELGCGAGIPCTQTMLDHPKEFNVTGVDISKAQVELAKEHLQPQGRVALIHCDMTKLDIRPETYDAVLAFYSIFHLPKDEQAGMISRMASWLKKGGVLLFNLSTEEGDMVIDDWMGAKMFSSGMGEEENRKVLSKLQDALEVEENVHTELVGRMEERFHWVWAVKR